MPGLSYYIPGTTLNIIYITYFGQLISMISTDNFYSCSLCTLLLYLNKLNKLIVLNTLQLNASQLTT